MRSGRDVFCAFALCLLTVPAASATIHVPGDQPTIQAGIDAALDGDTVMVADGIYTGDGNRDIDFLGKAITVRSATGVENCIIDCEGSEIEEHRGFHFHNGEGPDSVLQGFTIRNGYTSDVGGGILCYSSPVIISNTITGNSAGSWGGGGIALYGGNPMITDNTISLNSAYSESGPAGMGNGGGIFIRYDSSPVITNNIITNNSATYHGGGLFCFGSPGSGVQPPTVTNNIFFGNSADKGGALSCNVFFPSPMTLSNNTISENSSVTYGGAIECWNSKLVMINTIFWNNTAPVGPEIWVGDSPSEFTISYSDVEGGRPDVYVESGCTLNWGEGIIDADPLLVGGYYLSNIDCGDPETSPCVDAGDPTLETHGTTGCLAAWGSVDMGYHYPALGLVVGPGPSPDNPPTVRVFPPEQDAEPAFEFDAYGPRHYGVNVSCGDLFANSVDKILTGSGPGEMYGPHVRGLQVDGTPLSGLSFFAYGTNKWGVNVAAGDLELDGYDEIITGAGPGAVFGPHVRGWNYDGTGTVTAIPGFSYFAYGTPKWGVNVCTGDIDGDGIDEIVTGAGPGAVYGPHVRGWKLYYGEAAAMSGVSFFAYGTLKYGVNVTCGDVDGDGIDEIVTGAGPGAVFAPHVRGWDYDGSSVTPLPGLSFFAWNDFRFGVNVYAGTDLNGDGRAELVVGCGPDPEAGSEVKVYEYDGSGQILWFSLVAFPGMTHGTNVAAGCF